MPRAVPQRAPFALLAALALSAPAAGQERAAPARWPERAFVPERALDDILDRHPDGVLLAPSELEALVERARARAAGRARPAAAVPLAPVGATIERLRLRGTVDPAGVVELEAEAEVSVLWPGVVRLPLPLAGSGLTGVSCDDAPARLVRTRAGVEVLLEGVAPEGGARATRVVRWRAAARVAAGEEPGSGALELSLPSAASGAVSLTIPGELEPLGADPAVWVAARDAQSTELRAALGGEASTRVRLAWRPLRRRAEAQPYMAVEARELFRVRRGVVTVACEGELEVSRAPIERLELELPPGFVIRSLALEPGDESYVQRGDRVEVRLAAPRRGRLEVRLVAELATGEGDGGEAGANEAVAVTLRPVRWLDAARAAGALAVAADEEAEVAFGPARGLERADLAAFGGVAAPGLGAASRTQVVEDRGALLRAYRQTGEGTAELELAVRAVEPRATLLVKAALDVRERELRALAVYQFRVEAGTVFRVRADLPAGFAPVRTLVRDGAGAEPAHVLERVRHEDGRRGLAVELERGLRPGDALLVTVEAVWEAPPDQARGLAGSDLAVPRFGGQPADSVRGYLGFAPDAAFQLAGSELSGLVAIPAEELPRAGLEVPGLVLGYRIEEAGYAGTVAVRRRKTRLAAEVAARHRVAERLVSSDVTLSLDVDGAPIEELELLLPAGTGQAARIDGAGLRDERERVGVAPDGRERWRLRFAERVAGRITLRVRLEGQLAPAAAEPGLLEGRLPRVGVAGAYRERGTLAVYTADAVEVTAEAVGLRAIEGTEVGASDAERPLFAYRHVSGEYELALKVRRLAAAPVLTAVVERLELTTSAAPDGRARHEARFAVKNLANQFFALRLPEGATLWSVVVDGEGVKPAARAGVSIVPLPEAGAAGPDEVTEVVATYTHGGEPWGLVGDASLVAPALLVSEAADEPVPVLHTSWSLAVPGDYRVIDLGGNLEAERAPARARPLLLVPEVRAELRASGAPWLGALAVVGLLVAASARLRRGALGLLAGALGVQERVRAGRAEPRPERGARSDRGERAATPAGARVLQCLGLLALIAVGFAISVPNLIEARKHGNEAAAIGALKTLHTAQTLFREGDKEGDGVLDYGTLAELSAANLIDDVLGSGVKQGYRFAVLVSPQAPELMWMATAEPVQPPATGSRCFATNQSGAIRHAQEPIPLRADCRLPDGAYPVGDGADRRAGFVELAEPTFDGAPLPPAAPAPDMPSASAAEQNSVPQAEAAAARLDPARDERKAAEAELLQRAQEALAASDREADARLLEELQRELARGGVPAPPAPELRARLESSREAARPAPPTPADELSLGRAPLQAGAGGGAAADDEAPRTVTITIPEGTELQMATTLISGQTGTSVLVDPALADVVLDAPLEGLTPSEALLVLARRAGATLEERPDGTRVLTPAARAQAIVQEGTGGQVGLRSLVLSLSAVGERYRFSRPGGGALVRLRAVHESALTGLGGALALVGFALALGAPRLTRASALSILALGLALATGLPLLSSSPWVAPIANGLALGLALAIPALALVALAEVWRGAPFARLGAALAQVRAERRERAGGRGAAAAAALLLVLAAPSAARADEGEPRAAPEERVYVPYDPADPGSLERPKQVFVPRALYDRLWREAFGEETSAPTPRPVAPAVVTSVAYEGRLDAAGELTLTARVTVDVLAAGWQRVPLGLAGTGLAEDTITREPLEDGAAGAAAAAPAGEPARVVALPAGGYELVAFGPGRYRAELELVVPRSGRGHGFATIPALAAQLTIEPPADPSKRLLVDGARAQVERVAGGKPLVLAALGDAPTITLTLRPREVLSAGASEAAAESSQVAWIRRGFLELVAETRFDISGAGREGFVFALPRGLEVTRVELPGEANLLRAWRQVGERLELELRRPTDSTAVVRVHAEQRLDPSAASFEVPQVVAQGVTREAGVIGVAVASGLRVRVAEVDKLRQVEASRVTRQAGLLGTSVEWAFGFARRPCRLVLERVDEALEARADVAVRAVVREGRYELVAEARVEVRRGRLYALEIATPAVLELIGAPGGRGLDVRELTSRVEGEARIYRLGLGTALERAATVELRLARRLALGTAPLALPLPEVRVLGLTRETGRVALAASPGLEVRAPETPAGLEAQDVSRLTRGWPEWEGARWRLGYTWGASRSFEGTSAGLAGAAVRVKRPQAQVTGSWVLHALVERDVVRYALRALYEIEHAGVQRFEVVVPEAAAAKLAVDAANRREVSVVPHDEGRARVVIELQSPVEELYELAVTWEDAVGPGKPFDLPRVDVAGAVRRVRGFVLLEKAAEVADDLVERGLEGPVAPGRASNAPALPAGKGAQDFVRVYRVELQEEKPWRVGCELVARSVTLPPPARIAWAHLESVLGKEGRVRHRVRYRVRNLRLQFLPLAFPPGAEVWSVFVAGRPKRLHRDGELALVPLPKRSDADLSFVVEVLFATPAPGELGKGRLALVGPEVRLAAEKVEVEHTFWTVYAPEGYSYSGFDGPGLTPAGAQDARVAALESAVKELRALEEVARSGGGTKRQVADANLAEQIERIEGELAELAHLSSPGPRGSSFLGPLGKQREDFAAIQAEIGRRRAQDQAAAAQQAAKQSQLRYDVEGNEFQTTSSGWATNQALYKDKRVRWANVDDEAEQQRVITGQQAQGKGGPPAGQQPASDYTLNVRGGLSLDNAEVVERERGAAGQSNRARRGLLQQRAVPAQQVVEQEILGGFAGQQAARNQAQVPAWVQRDEERGRASSQGLLSIRVAFAAPGRPFHFAVDGAAAPSLQLTSAPIGTAETLGRAARALALLLLVVGLARLGLLVQHPGRGAMQALLLLGGVALAALAVSSLIGAAIAAILGLLAARRGPLWPAAADAPTSPQEAA